MKKGEETRERLLKCAEKSFSKKGFYETQVSDIVKLAHVAKGTIYQYFKNKEEIFTTLLETYIKAWEKDIAIDMKDFTGGKPALDYAIDYLRHRLLKTAAFFGENQDRTNIVLRIGVGVNDEFEPIIRKFESKILNVIIHDIELAQRQGHIPRDLNIELASNAVMGAIIRLNYYLFVMNKRSVSRMNINAIAEEGVKLVYSTLRMK